MKQGKLFLLYASSFLLCLRSPGARTPVSSLCHHKEQRGQRNGSAVAQPSGHPHLRVVVRKQHGGRSAFQQDLVAAQPRRAGGKRKGKGLGDSGVWE